MSSTSVHSQVSAEQPPAQRNNVPSGLNATERPRIAGDAASRPSKQDERAPSKAETALIHEIKELLIFDGLTRREIEDRIAQTHKRFTQERIHDLVSSTYRKLTEYGVNDGNGNRYFVNDGNLYLASGTGEKSTITRLANFSLISVGTVIRDDGVEKHRSFEVEAKLGERVVRDEVSIEEFQRMTWPMKLLGASALVVPRKAPETEYGLRTTAKQNPDRILYTHTGWRLIDGKPYFLHAHGAMGPQGNRKDVIATLSEKLRGIALPDAPAGEDLKAAIRASMGLLKAAKEQIAFPLFSAIYRAPLGDSAFTLFSSGSTGLRKTALNLVAQQHFGKDFDEEQNVLHWDATSNFLKEILFAAKDVTLLIDDFVPAGSNRDVQRAHVAADEVLRSVANKSGRGRLGRDGRPQVPHEPRALVFATGETRPSGHSLTARMVHISFSSDSVENQALSDVQRAAKAGKLAEAMAGYVQFVAQRYRQITGNLKARIDEIRGSLASEARHLRSATNVANLLVGFEVFLAFAIDAGAISTSEADELWGRMWAVALKLTREQDEVQQGEDPARQVIRLLRSALQNGVVYAKDLDPGEQSVSLENAPFIGWKESSDRDQNEFDYYFDPEALYSTIVQLYREQNSVPPWEKNILWERLSQQGYTWGKGDRKYYFRKSIDGKQQRLIAIPAETFRKLDEDDETTPRSPASFVLPRRSW